MVAISGAPTLLLESDHPPVGANHHPIRGSNSAVTIDDCPVGRQGVCVSLEVPQSRGSKFRGRESVAPLLPLP